MARKEISTAWDRNNRNNMNDNFTELYNVQNRAIKEATQAVIEDSKLIWQHPVNTFADLATTYPNATTGYTVMTRDTGIVYRYNEGSWKEIQEIDPTVINEVDKRLTAQLAQTDADVENLKNPLNIVSLFNASGWKFHKNVTVDSSSKITLNADGNYQSSIFILKVKPNTQYTVSKKESNGYIQIYEVNLSTSITGGITRGSVTFNSTNRTEVAVVLTNRDLGVGTFTFENIMLNEGSKAIPFKPRTREHLIYKVDEEIVNQELNKKAQRLITFSNQSPLFERYGNNPIWSNVLAGVDSIIKPFVVNVEHLTDPIDKYYMYYSCDHQTTGETGIFLATGPTPYGPFTKYGRVYSDVTSGHDAEDCEVIWNEKTNLFHMYFHRFGSVNQVNFLATSPDGINWTFVKEVNTIPNRVEFIGDGHTGYVNVWRIGGVWYMLTLFGGQDLPHFALWRSYDGIDWVIDPRLIGNNYQFTTEEDRRTDVRFHPFIYDGLLWAISVESNFVSGSAEKISNIVVGTLSDDFRKFTSPLQECLIGDKPSWETDNVRSTSLFRDVDGQVYLYYSIDNSFGVATLEEGGM